MFFDASRAQQRVSWWANTLLESLNTNVPCETYADLMTEYEDRYTKRIQKPALECLLFAKKTMQLDITHLGSLLLKYFLLLGVLVFIVPWTLFFFAAVNLESILKIAIWILIALPIMCLVILLCDIRFTPRIET